MKLTVSKFAKLADTTVRTLRHYRQLGILVPSQKNENDHYIYVNEDFKRLHEIQLLQSLGLSLNEIKVCLENPKYSFKEIIRVQEQSLQQRREAIDYSLALIERIQLLTEQDQLLESNSEILMLLMNSMRVEKAQKKLLQKYVSMDIIDQVFPEDISKQTYLDGQLYNLLLLVHRAIVNDLKPDHPCIQQQLQEIVANTPLNNLIFYNEVHNEEFYKNVKPYESLVPKHTMDFLKEAFEVFNTKKNSSLKD
ncbi:MerR family transcriptional regulator [Paenibacillus sp. UMB7766-LJ446]|uniref:MerR family transcriptional regulator n=1 Tax=Paenibacillus sp. UMB7766-LJ446 TaxID=3046313 RepID=UPI00255086D8|nr:MerR family transcriptional regulator [Paenibacillus sp. UMB7766-LJ446]MDK8189782.1 MerR family transcriptional regulator [Paenibacillus sp. UMB7766-LJ446]